MIREIYLLYANDLRLLHETILESFNYNLWICLNVKVTLYTATTQDNNQGGVFRKAHGFDNVFSRRFESH